MRLLRIVSTANRGLRAARQALARRRLAYVVAINVIVLLLGAGGMYAFEGGGGGTNGLKSYGDALWWTAMLLTTLGAGFEPRIVEGRLLAYLLALFGLSVFGYLTATFASLFVQQDKREDGEQGALVTAGDIAALRAEVRALRDELRRSGDDSAG